MKNRFLIMGDTTIIYAIGRGIIHEVLIDTKYLQLVSSIGTWTVAYDKNNKVGRVVASNPSIALHRLIIDYYGELPIDHKDRNPLNNKRDNLRISTTAENGQNRGVNRNSKTGVRGLNWDRVANKYRARTQIDGKRITIGLFDTIEEGKKALTEYRTKYTTSID